MPTAGAVIIGGGVSGTSIALHLARRGVSDVILLEKRFLASGGTGKSTALVRQHYDNYPEARMVYESWKYFTNWAEMVGGEAGFVKTGFIRTVIPEETEALKANVKMQQDIGIHTQLVTAAEVRELEPYFDVSDIEFAAYEPDSGFADPQATTLSQADAAKRQGAKIMQDVRVTAINTSGSRITGVSTEGGDISSPVVIVAAGFWSVDLCKPLGLELPLTAERHQLATFRRPAAIVKKHRCVVDGSLEMYFKPEGHDLTVVGAGTGQPIVDADRYNEGADEDNIQYAAERIQRRIPLMEDALSLGGWSGVYDMTPDEKMIFGALPLEGLYICAGHSGTGFKMGPAVGLLLSELICDGKTSTMDISPFRLSRFAEKQPLYGEHPYSTSWHTGRTNPGGEA